MARIVLIKRMFIFGIVMVLTLGIFSLCTQAASKNISLDFLVTKNLIEVTENKTSAGAKFSLTNPTDDTAAFAYLHRNLNDNWGGYSGIALSLEHTGETPLKINMHVHSKDNQYKIGDEASIIFKAEDEKISLHKCKYGSLEVPIDSNIEIYIPFSGFVNENTGEFSDAFLQETITGFGITLLPSANSEGSVLLKNIFLVDAETEEKYGAYGTVELMGRDSVPTPILGESVYPYSLGGVNENNTVRFYLQESYVGVSLSEEGLLTLTTDVTADSIVLNVSVDDKLNIEMPIQLTRWVLLDKTMEDGTPLSLLSPEESPSVNATTELLELRNYTFFVRAVLIGGCVIFLIMYQSWREKWKLDSNKNKV